MAVNKNLSAWVQQAYDRFWAQQQDITEERHGIKCLPQIFPGVVTMVLDEYEQIWDSITAAQDEYPARRAAYAPGALVVTGQPGSGTSGFVKYAFARALRDRKDVAHGVGTDEYYFCDANGCRYFGVIMPGYPYDGPRDVLSGFG